MRLYITGMVIYEKNLPTHTEMALRMQANKRYSESMDSIIGGSDIWCEWNTSMDIPKDNIYSAELINELEKMK